MKRLFLKRKNQLIFSIGIILIISIALQSVQMMNKNLYLGPDWVFHYNRFYDAAQQIKEGNFQCFISMYGFSQSGRIVNALYGPMFAYLQGLILLLCGSWLKYQIVSNFLITFLSGISMFTLLLKTKIRLSVSLILAVTYTTFYIVQSWSFNQAFGSWGAVIIPLGVLAGTKFITNENYFKTIPLLVLTMTLAIQVHLLTALLLIATLSIFFIAGFIQTKDKKNLLISVLIAAVITVFTTANVWYPLLETSIENQLLRPFVNADMESSAIRLALNNPANHLTIASFGLFIFQYLLLLFVKVGKLNKIVTFQSFVFFILSSKIIPWNEIAPKFSTITMLQFPSRLFLPAVILGALSVALSIESLFEGGQKKFKKTYIVYAILIGLCLLGIKVQHDSANEKLASWKTDTLQPKIYHTVFKENDPSLLRQSFDKEAGLNKALILIVKATHDYLPAKNKNIILDEDFNPAGEYKNAVINNPLNKELSKKVEDHQLKLEWEAEDGSEALLPIIVYKRTQLSLNGEVLAKNEFKTNEIGALIVAPKTGNNELTVQYNTSPLFRYMMVISFLSWLILIFLWVRNLLTPKS
ncbi:MAG: hypothetical protein L0L10_07525 [Tetragenococcus sp.]|nr:hypothetical protein [Tetragenococcus sp.]